MPRSAFAAALADRSPDPANRRWLFVPYDQLHHAIGPLAQSSPDEVGIVLVESPDKANRRPYHRQKLALVLTNLRHFALEQAERGVAVRHVVSTGDYAAALRPLVAELGPLRCMVPAERELRQDLAALAASGGLDYVPHDGWLSSRDNFEQAHPKGPPWRMDAFYRGVRRKTGLLMHGGKPEGGKWSFDAANRKAWSGKPAAPKPPEFEPDAVTLEVCALVERQFAGHPGQVDPMALPATQACAEASWDWAMRECLPWFGPFQDAMSQQSSSLFHARISPLLHLHRLLPRRVVEDVAAMDLELPSREGFVRQVLGWREFVRHVHERTDGFRELPGEPVATDEARAAGGDAAPMFLAGTDRPLPQAFWSQSPGELSSGMHCLDATVRDVWQQGYGHHITRLMVLSNIATLLDVSPRELTDWFWVAYTDAFDWVVEPNVLGMGTFSVGELMTTKPYVAGSNYIDKMGDFCSDCVFDPKSNCPLRSLYWAFLDRHQEQLQDNPRLRMPMASLRKRAPAQRAADRELFERVSQLLQDGLALSPDNVRARG